MAEALADDLHVDASGEQVRGMGVAQVVQPNHRHAGLVDQSVECLANRVGPHRVANVVGEHSIVDRVGQVDSSERIALCLPVCFEQRSRIGVDVDRSAATAGLQCGHDLLTFHDGDGLADAHVSESEIDVAPSQADRFAATDPDRRSRFGAIGDRRGAVAVDVWPQRSKTRARRKVARTRRSVDVRTLSGPTVMSAAINAIATHQPASNTYRVMTAVAYYAGLRPSEVVMLRVRSVQLPANGWGRLDVTEADISFDEPGEPKIGPRSVPIPPVLVNVLSEWIATNRLTSQDGCCSGPATTTVRADRTGPGHGTAPSNRSARNRCAYTTADTQPPPPGSAPACLSPQPHAASDTPLKHSSAPASAPSTTKNTPPTDASTPASNREIPQQLARQSRTTPPILGTVRRRSAHEDRLMGLRQS